MLDNGRAANGHFAKGNPGGPGRPRRAVERDYLAVLGETVTLADWRDVVSRAVADAKAGDATARAWLAKYVLGEGPTNFLDLAAKEHRDWTPDDEICRLSNEQEADARRRYQIDTMMGRFE